MTPEEKKKADETAAAEALEKEQADADFEAEIAELSEEEQAAKRAEREAPPSDIDYKAIALEERTKREAAEKALADKRFKDADRKRKAKDEPEEDLEDDEDEDKPVTRKDLTRIINETTQQTEKRLMGNRIKELATGLAGSIEEAEAIMETHANWTFPPSYSLEEQVEAIHAIVNRKKINSTNSELKRALKSKGTASKDSAPAHRDPMPSTGPKLSTGDAAAYKRAGFTLDTTDKLWKKKLPNGKILIKNPKTKKVSLA